MYQAWLVVYLAGPGTEATIRRRERLDTSNRYSHGNESEERLHGGALKTELGTLEDVSESNEIPVRILYCEKSFLELGTNPRVILRVTQIRKVASWDRTAPLGKYRIAGSGLYGSRLVLQ